MTRLVVLEYTSIDGVIQAPGHAGEDDAGGFAHGGWTIPHMSEHPRYVAESFHAADAFLFGRLTYEIFAAYWPTVTDPTHEIATALNTRPKYVASSTLRDPTWARTAVLGPDVPAAIAELRAQPGRELLVVGSAALARTLFEHGLVDEYRLMIHPIVLGSGKRLFAETAAARQMDLIDARTSASGLVVITYRPHDAAA